MSASPTNANLGQPWENTSADASRRRVIGQPPAYYAPGREALQALLAFSSLHEQIRQRRARQSRANTAPDTAEVWQPEQFVLDEVLQLVSERALAITGTDGVAIALADGEEIRCRASAGTIAPDPGIRLDPNSGFSGACLRTGLIVRCDDSEKDPRVDRAACQRLGLRSIVAVPLMTEYGVIGLLAAFCSEAYGFNDSDVRSLSLLAELILAALKPEEEYEQEQTPPAQVAEDQRTVSPATEVRAETHPIEPAKAEGETPRLEPPLQAEATAPSVLEEKVAGLPNVQSLRQALARVTEESGQALIPEPIEAQNSPAFLFSTDEAPQTSQKRLKLAGTILLGLLALALIGGALWWWDVHHRSHQIEPASATAENPPQTSPGSGTDESAADNVLGKSSSASTVQVTGIRHWSSADSSTVAIDLQDPVQYEEHRLSNPDRIYFDLHDTALVGRLQGTTEVDDALLVRFRIAQLSPDVTRVVLETKDSPNFSVSMETNPYRLVVEITSATAKPKTGKVDLFAPMSSAQSKRQQATAKTPPGTWLEPPQETAENTATTRAAKFRIVLDAGHGGWDLGTVGRRGLMEKNLVLDIVARLGSLISSRMDAEVVYTRRNDTYVPLERRTEIANLAQADMFLSVHGNYSDTPSARGVETYYTNTYSSVHARTHDGDDPNPTSVSLTNVDIREKVQQSRHFAEQVQESLYHALFKKDPAVRDRGVKEASFVVLTGTTMPAILAEVSFVSSPTDEAKLENAAYRQQMAEALYKGVAAYAGNLHRVNLASAATHQAGQ